MTKEILQVEDGYIIIPDAPGIGIEFIDDLQEKFPPNHRDLTAQIRYDGSVQDR